MLVTMSFSVGLVCCVLLVWGGTDALLPTLSPHPAHLLVNLSQVSFDVDAEFLSVALGIEHLEGNWAHVNLTAPRIINMAKALNPTMLRLGGTRADFLIFGETMEHSKLSHSMQRLGMSHVPVAILIILYFVFLPSTPSMHNAGNYTNHTMTTAQWDAVNEFVRTVGWEFIFGLNSLLRNPYPVGVWDSTNAAQLMSYSTSKGYTVNWELGNGQLST